MEVSLYHWRRLAKRLHTLLTTTQSVVSPSSFSSREPSLSCTDSTTLRNNRTLLVSSMVLSSVERQAKCIANFEVLLSYFFPSQGARPSPLGLSWSFTRSHPGHTLQATLNSAQSRLYTIISSISPWRLGITTLAKPLNSFALRMFLINILTLHVSW